MTTLGSVSLLGLSLLLSAGAGCGKKSDAPAPAAAPAQTEAPPPATPPPAGPQPGAEPASVTEACKKTVATNCALPCEKRVQASEKDPQRLRTELNACMVTCLTQAEKTCNHH